MFAKRNIQIVLGALGFIGILIVAGTASAVSTVTLTAADVNVASGEFDVLFDGNIDGAQVPGLSAEANFALTGFSYDNVADETTLTLTVALTNTSTGPIDSSGVTAMGFNVDPDLTGASASGDFSVYVLDNSFPNNFGDVDICFKATGTQNNNCKGGQNGPEGGSDVTNETVNFTMALVFDGAITEATLDNFGVRYQRIYSEQLDLDDDSGTGEGNGGVVPEPNAALVLALGGLVVGARRRRR